MGVEGTEGKLYCEVVGVEGTEGKPYCEGVGPGKPPKQNKIKIR